MTVNRGEECWAPADDSGGGSNGHTSPSHVLGALLSGRRWSATIVWLLLSASFAVGLIGIGQTGASLSREFIYRKDFVQEYVLARALLEHVPPYGPVAALVERFIGPIEHATFPHPTPHPPFVGLVLSPLALLSYESAAAVWLSLELLALLAIAIVLVRVLGDRLPLWLAPVLAVSLVAWEPVRNDLVVGQLMVPLTLLLCAGWMAWRSGRSGWAGVIVGLAILTKTMPWPLLLVFGLRRDWRAVAYGVGTVGLGYAASTLIFGLPAMESYLRSLPQVAAAYSGHSHNISLFSVGTRLFVGTGSPVMAGFVAQPIWFSPTLAWLTNYVAPAAALVLLALAARRLHDRGALYGTAMCVSVIVSPVAWSHYLVLAVVPAACLVAALVRQRLPVRETNLALAVALLLLLPSDAIRAVFMAVGTPASDENVAVPLWAAALMLLYPLGLALLAWLVARTAREIPSRAVLRSGS
ncbi:MAG: glycosyltransferase family 87 protein [Chloroflexota bacterium]